MMLVVTLLIPILIIKISFPTALRITPIHSTRNRLRYRNAYRLLQSRLYQTIHPSQSPNRNVQLLVTVRLVLPH